MRRHVKLLATLCCCCLMALAVGETAARSRLFDAPHRFQPASQDLGLVQIANPVDGRIWAAWAFRDGDGYDIAVALMDEHGRWNEPTFLGRYDGKDQIDPTFVVHASGAMALAFAEPATGRILISLLGSGGEQWSRPLPVASGADLGAPSLMILGDRLVLGYRSGDRVELRTMNLFVDAAGTFGFTDGPDPVGIDDGVDSDEDEGKDDDDDPDSSSGRTGMVPMVDSDR